MLQVTDGSFRGKRSAGTLGTITLLGSVQALPLAAGFFRWKIIALTLGPFGVGIAGLIDQISQVVLQLGGLNLPSASLRFLGAAHYDGTGTFGRLYRGFLLAVLGGCATVAAIAVVVFRVQPGLLGEGLEPFALPLAIALMTVPLTGATNLVRNTLVTLGRHRDVAIAMGLGALALAAATFAGVHFGGLTGLYLAVLVASALILLALSEMVRRDPRARTDGEPVAPWVLLRAQPGVLRYTATIYAVGFSVPLGYSVVRASVLGTLGPESAGFLAAAYTIALAARTIFTQTGSQFLTPRASRAAPKPERAREVVGYLHVLAVAMLVAALPVTLFPHEVLRVLYSAKFAPAAAFLGFFLLSELMMAFGDAYRVLLLGFDDLRGYLYTTIAAPVAVIAGAAWVIPAYGISGISFLQIGAAGLGLVMSLVRLYRRHGVGLDGRALALYGLMIVSVVFASVVGRSTPGFDLTTAMWKSALGLVLAAGSIALLPELERTTLWRFLSFRGGRASTVS